MNKKKKLISLIIIFVIFIMIIVILLFSKNNKTYAVGNTLADTVIAQNKGDTWESGASGVYYTNNHEYRYVGANVNNYVSFNNDLYRIIGVFDSNSHGQDGKMLVKLIRSRILGSYAYGVYNTNNTSGTYSGFSNDYTKGNLNILLNEYFYNKTDTSSTYGNCSTWTYYGGDNDMRTNNCSDIVGYGIKSNLQNYLETVTWYLYGPSNYTNSKQFFYSCERGNGCTGANGASNESKVKIQNKIGLMYVSDYLYASGYFSDSDTTVGSSSMYGNQNWLYKGFERTITPASSDNNSTMYITYDSGLNGVIISYDSDVTTGYGVRPTFYLKSSVYVTGGTGTFSDPYTISCDDCNI